MKKNKFKNYVAKAIYSAGSQAEFARYCGVAQQTVSKWMKKGVVPPRKVILVEKLSGIPRHQLNPEIYPD